jgi:hypothetical protein
LGRRAAPMRFSGTGRLPKKTTPETFVDAWDLLSCRLPCLCHRSGILHLGNDKRRNTHRHSRNPKPKTSWKHFRPDLRYHRLLALSPMSRVRLCVEGTGEQRWRRLDAVKDTTRLLRFCNLQLVVRKSGSMQDSTGLNDITFKPRREAPAGWTFSTNYAGGLVVLELNLDNGRPPRTDPRRWVPKRMEPPL